MVHLLGDEWIVIEFLVYARAFSFIQNVTRNTILISRSITTQNNLLFKRRSCSSRKNKELFSENIRLWGRVKQGKTRLPHKSNLLKNKNFECSVCSFLLIRLLSKTIQMEKKLERCAAQLLQHFDRIYPNYTNLKISRPPKIVKFF